MSNGEQPLITNIVVVMLENRSYDNVLGWLSGLTGAKPNLDSQGKSYSVHNDATTQIGGHGQTYPGTVIPAIDPGELFGDMAQQFLGLDAVPMKMPYGGYVSGSAPMTGYVKNYEKVSGASSSNYGDVMNYLTAAQLPVTSFLASNYAVSDRWFAPVPTQTFTNRLFAFCAAPAIITTGSGSISLVNDEDYPFHLIELIPDSNVLDLPSICSQLDAVKPNGKAPYWKLYFHDYSIAVLSIPYIANAARSKANANVSTFDNSDWGSDLPGQLAALPSTFVTDALANELPPFTFIEPRYSATHAKNPLPPGSNHPGPGDYGILRHSEPTDPPIDASGGELLLMQVYNLLQQTKNWPSTLLIVTYDEPGGTYDHVAPLTAKPPGSVKINWPATPTTIPAAGITHSKDTAANGFDYSLYGGRVPAIIISPLVAQETVPTTTPPFDHTSIIKTAWDAFNLSASTPAMPSLTERDLCAPSLFGTLSTSANNDAGPFAGTIVASPSGVILNGSKVLDVPWQTLLASAGPGITITATPSTQSGGSWLAVTSADGTPGTNTTVFTISVDTHGLGSGTYFGSLLVEGSGGGNPVEPVTVPVTLYFSEV